MRVGDLVESVYPYHADAMAIISRVESAYDDVEDRDRRVFSVVYTSGPFAGCEMIYFESDFHVHHRAVV